MSLWKQKWVVVGFFFHFSWHVIETELGPNEKHLCLGGTKIPEASWLGSALASLLYLEHVSRRLSWDEHLTTLPLLSAHKQMHFLTLGNCLNFLDPHNTCNESEEKACGLICLRRNIWLESEFINSVPLTRLLMQKSCPSYRKVCRACSSGMLFQ